MMLVTQGMFLPLTAAPGHNRSHLVIPTNVRDLQS